MTKRSKQIKRNPSIAFQGISSVCAFLMFNRFWESVEWLFEKAPNVDEIVNILHQFLLISPLKCGQRVRSVALCPSISFVFIMIRMNSWNLFAYAISNFYLCSFNIKFAVCSKQPKWNSPQPSTLNMLTVMQAVWKRSQCFAAPSTDGSNDAKKKPFNDEYVLFFVGEQTKQMKNANHIKRLCAINPRFIYWSFELVPHEITHKPKQWNWINSVRIINNRTKSKEWTNNSTAD